MKFAILFTIFATLSFDIITSMKRTPTWHFALAITKDNTPDRDFINGVAAFSEDQPQAQFQIITPDKLEREIRRGYFDGIICRATDERLTQLITQKNLPAIDILNSSFKSNIPRIVSDNQAIGRMAADHFLERRFKNFAFFGYRDVNYSIERRNGFLAKLRQSGYDALVCETSPNSWRKYGHVTLPGYTLRTSSDEHRLIRILLSAPRPLAAFCCHDPRAVCVLEACKSAGMAIPKDIAILGVDNDSVHCNFSSPKLSSIDPNARAIGYEAARRLYELHNHPNDSELMQPVHIAPLGVVVRESSEIYPIEPMWLSDALVFIKNNAASGISATDVFDFLGLSHTHVQSAFRKTLHTSVQREIINERMSIACRLLQTTDLSVSAIASRAGFASPRYFCQAFTGQYRLSPSAWRDSHRK